MNEFVLFGLGFLAVFRLIAMFTRERVPGGEPLMVDGELVRAKVGRGKYRRIDFLAVGFDAPRGWRFNLRREGFFDRFAKGIGLAQEFQTKDVPFDGRIYIECDDSLLHRQLAAHRPLRQQIFALFDSDAVKSLTCVEGRLWFTLSTAGWDKELADEQIGRQAASPLQAGVRVLREQMATSVISDDSARDPTRITRRHFMFAMLALGGVAAIAVIWQINHQNHQVVIDGIYRMAGWAASCVVAALLLTMLATLGGTARSQRVLLDILFAGIPAAWLAGFGGAMYLNESLDASTARRVPVLIERAWVTTGKHSAYYLSATRWPDTRALPVVMLGRDEYRLMESKGCIDVLWHTGRFGDGWIEGYQSHGATGCDEGVEQ